MICVTFTAFYDLRANLRIRLTTLRESVRKNYVDLRVRGQGFSSSKKHKLGRTCLSWNCTDKTTGGNTCFGLCWIENGN